VFGSGVLVGFALRMTLVMVGYFVFGDLEAGAVEALNRVFLT
jgi:hypothetical protein